MAFKPKNVERLRDFIAKARFKFDMDSALVEPKCGSAGCIGGHAAYLWPSLRLCEDADGYTFADSEMAEKLGISTEVQQSLCYEPVSIKGGRMALRSVTRSMAVAGLNNLIANNGEKVRFPSPRKRKPA